MEQFKNILAVCRSTEHCVTALHTGISLARQYKARLHVMHVIHDPFSLNGWNLPVPSFEEEYKQMVAKARKELDRIIQKEKGEGVVVNEWVKDGDPADDIQKVVEDENIDLVVLLAHKEGRLEHFLFGKTNDEVIRRLPTSLMLVKY